MTKKALIYDPYLDTLGGGERYSLTFGLELLSQGYEVEIAWSNNQTLVEASKRFGLDFTRISLNSDAYKLFSSRSSIVSRFLLTRKYDLIFWVSDGSIPVLFSKNNLVHFQVPFKTINQSSLLGMVKRLFVNKFVYNSKFTQSILEPQIGNHKSFILYPPIDTRNFKSQKKENIILSVARFSSLLTSKRQDVLIEAFRELSKTKPNYKLILCGGLVGDDKVVDDLRKQSEGLNVEIIVNPNFSELVNLYSKSKFFWHAAGYQIDQCLEPEKVEHFGMTTVEAMASGVIPVVINRGGQQEILDGPLVGLLCQDISDLVKTTNNLDNNSTALKEISEVCLRESKKYSLEVFSQRTKLLTEGK